MNFSSFLQFLLCLSHSYCHCDEDLITILSKSIDDYITYIPKPRAGIVAKKQATDQMRALFTDSDKVLKEMDTLVTMLQFTNTDLYTTYFSSSKLINPGYRTLALRGTITDTEGMPIQKATVTIESIGITKKTTDKGAFEIKDMKSGLYALLVSKPGYLDTRTVVAVTATERTQFSAILEPDTTTEKVA